MSPDDARAKSEARVSALSSRELIALLLQSGTKSKSVLELADEVLSCADRWGSSCIWIPMISESTASRRCGPSSCLPASSSAGASIAAAWKRLRSARPMIW
ncbi:MAG: UPF0758 domain-containing protein [Merdibacter sp.]